MLYSLLFADIFTKYFKKSIFFNLVKLNYQKRFRNFCEGVNFSEPSLGDGDRLFVDPVPQQNDLRDVRRQEGEFEVEEDLVDGPEVQLHHR